MQKELIRGITRGKDSYRRKLEKHLKGRNAREVWRGLKTISGHTKDSARGPESGDQEWANELNLFFFFFFYRFDCPTSPSPTHQSSDLTVMSHPQDIDHPVCHFTPKSSVPPRGTIAPSSRKHFPYCSHCNNF